jgi:hypothetical protein
MLHYKMLGNGRQRVDRQPAVVEGSISIKRSHLCAYRQMKAELHIESDVPKKAVTVIPFGVNNSVPDTDLTPNEAKRRLGIDS